MAENSKGKRSLSRRSSILKRALADIDVNVREKTEYTRSKRVSFAETCCVKEFMKDSPQTVTAAVPDNGNTSGDSTVFEATPQDNAKQLPQQDVAQTAPESSFMVDEWETSLISGVTDPGGYHESTRAFDRMDLNTFGSAGGLDVSEITEEENSVLVPASSARKASVPNTSTSNRPTGSNALTNFGPKGFTQDASNSSHNSVLVNQTWCNKTVLFDQSDGNMDLTLMESTRSSTPAQPELNISAQDFFKELRSSSGSHSKKTETSSKFFMPSAKENQVERTMIFDDQDGGTMDLTLMDTTRPSLLAQPAQKISFNDFLTKLTGANCNPLANQETLAKPFLQERQNSASEGVSSKKQDKLLSGASGQEDDDNVNVTMEMTCQDLMQATSTLPLSADMEMFQPSLRVSAVQGVLQEPSLQTENNVEETMELTACVKDVKQGLANVSRSATAAEANGSKSPSRMRNALVDITARYSTSPEVSQSSGGKQIVAQLPENQYLSRVHPSNMEPDQTIVFTTEETEAEMEMTNVYLNNADAQVSRKIVVRESLTCGVTSDSGPERKSLSSKGVLFNKEETNADMSFTCTNLPPCMPLGKSDSRSAAIMFDKEDTVADMSLTCANLSQSVVHSESQRSGKAVMFGKETMAVSARLSRSSALGKEETEADKSLSGSTMANYGLHVKSQSNKSVLFDKQETAADMSLTCVNLTRPEQGQWHSNKSVVFGKEETAANMSPTWASQPSAAHENLQSNKSVVFDKEETAANMSLTCVNLTRSAQGPPHSNETLKFDKEETAANMSLTCLNLTRSAQGPPHSNETVKFDKEGTAANMSLTCVNLTRSAQGQPHSNETVKFDKEETEANMSLTCVNLTRSAQGLPHSNKTVKFDKEETAANMSLTCGNLTRSAQGPPHSNETVKSDKEETAANMSLTCDNLTRSAQEQLHSNKTVMFDKEETAANMSLTCVNLTRSAQGPPHSNKSDIFDKEETAANMSLTCAIQPSTNGHLQSNRSVVCDKEETAANMSITHAHRSDAMPKAKDQADCKNREKTFVSNSFVDNFPSSTVSKTQLLASDRGMNEKLDVGNETNLRSACSPLRTKPSVECSDVVKVDSGIANTNLAAVNTSKTQADLGSIGQDTHLSMATLPRSETSFNKDRPVGLEQALVLSSDNSKSICKRTSSDMLPISFNKEELETEISDSSAAPPGPYESLKRQLQNLSVMGPEPKVLRLAQTDSSDNSFQTSHGDQIQSSKHDMDVLEMDHKEIGNSNSSTTRLEDSAILKQAAKPSVQRPTLTSESSNGSVSTPSPDILDEAMPEFFPAVSDTSAAAGNSVLAEQHTSGPSMSLGRSFVDQASMEQPCSFLQICEQLDIPQFELQGKVCRRSNGIIRPELACESVEDRLSVHLAVRTECSTKAAFHSKISDLLQREQAAAKEIEKTVMKEITQANLVTEAEQSSAVSQQIRGLLNASKKHSKAVLKLHKAEMLCMFAKNMKNQKQVVCKDLSEMTTTVEQMYALTEMVSSNISRLQDKMKALHNSTSSRKQRSELKQVQEKLQHGHEDLVSLQEKVKDAKSCTNKLDQEQVELEMQMKRAQQSHDADLHRQQQLQEAASTLSTFQSIHCWRPLRVEKQQVDVLLLYDSVLMSVTLMGDVAPQQPVHSITVTSRLREGSEPWAELATQLTVDILNTRSQHLMSSFSTRQQLPQLLDDVTQVVESIKMFGQEVKLACLKHRVTITGKQITAAVWCIEQLRKVVLQTEVPVDKTLVVPLVWHVDVVMGDVSKCHLEKTIEEVKDCRNYFTNVLQAVHCVLKQ